MPGSFVAETRFSGCIVTSRWPRDAVERLLPEGLHVVDKQMRPRGHHPVLFIFGEHDRSAVLLASLRVTTGVTFPELVIAVPFVRRKRHEPSLFVAQVFSGEPVVTWSGNVHYGFSKRMVRMERLGHSFVVNDERGALLTHATTEPAGQWRSATLSSLRSLTSAIAIGGLPVLGQRADRAWVTSRFDWCFAQSSVRPVQAVVSIDTQVARGLGPRRCHGSATDSIEVRHMSWSLSWPDAGAQD